MIHFNLAIILSLVTTSFATNPGSSSIIDETTSLISHTSDSSSTTAISATTEAVSTSSISSDSDTSYSSASSTTSATSDTSASSTTSDTSLSSTSSTTSYTSHTSSSSTTSCSSTTAASSSSSSSASPDLTRLFGENNQPNITHLGVVKCPSGAGHDPTKDAASLLVNAATVLFGLTKCNDKGEWIKSMFDLPHPDNVVEQGALSAQVVLLSTDGDNNWKRWTKKIERNNLEKLGSYGIDTSQIEEPWWPWALIEGALQAGWEPTSNNDRVADLLKILTGEERVLNMIDTSDNSKVIWDNTFSQADFSPILILRPTAYGFIWSVVMSPPFDKDGHKQLKWARPYADVKGDSHGEIDDTFRQEISATLHLEDLSPFTGRASSLQG